MSDLWVPQVAETISPIVGERWQPWRHLLFLIGAIEREMAKPNGRLIVNMPPRHGKALEVSTPIPTPSGWSRIGDLRVGDCVFDESGHPTPVVGVSPVWRGRKVHGVIADTGQHVVADESHEWIVRLDRKRGVFSRRETGWLARRASSRRPLVTKHPGLALPDADLPVPPYVLGYWLGDGSARNSTVTIGSDDRDFVVPKLGATPQARTPKNFTVPGLRPKLRALDVLENKHIPARYLRASRRQRMSLLQGLVDSDGYVARDGQVEFCSTNRRLALGARELVVSLGVKASLIEGRATLNGMDCGPKWRVMFYAADAATLPRKAARCRDGVKSSNHYLEFEPASEIADTVCIEVASPSHMFLAGDAMIPTCNSVTTSHWLPVAFLEAFPQRKVILTSYEHSIAEAWGRRVRDTFLAPGLRTKVNPKKAASYNWETTEGGGMRTAGSGGAITGTGGHLMIVDDPTKDWQDAHSPVMRKHLIEWFRSTFYTRAEPGACIVVNMTRWHQHDLTGWILDEHTDDWTHITLPAIAEADDAMGRAEGEALCDERYTAAELQRIKGAAGSAVWAGLYQQRPMPAEGSILKKHWMQYYDVLPPDVRPIGISVDASFGDTKKADGSYVVLQAWGAKGGDYYLLDQVRARMDFVETLVALRGMISRWPRCRARWIEKKANGAAIISQLRSAVSGLIPVDPGRSSKEARASAVSPFFEAGNVHLPRKAPWLADYEEELCSFPSAANDDQVDATTQALLKMTSKRRSAGGGFGGAIPH